MHKLIKETIPRASMTLKNSGNRPKSRCERRQIYGKTKFLTSTEGLKDQ